MMNKHTLGAAAVALALTATAHDAKALVSSANCVCTYYHGDQAVSGDVFYRNLNWLTGTNWCNGTVKYFLRLAFGMDAADWDNGFGHNSCDMSRPFGRTMNGITALMSAPVNPVPNLNWQAVATKPMIEWAGKWAMSEIDEMDGRCMHPSAPGLAEADGSRIILYVRQNINCKMAFFHGFTAVERAGTLVHEARHVHGPTHYASAKDYFWGWGGAYEWEARWLEQYITMGNPATQNKVSVCSARARLKELLKEHFSLPTGMVPPPVNGC